MEQTWFAGCLTAYDAQKGLSKIDYYDGDEEWLYLAMESYMISSAGEHSVWLLHSIGLPLLARCFPTMGTKLQVW